MRHACHTTKKKLIIYMIACSINHINNNTSLTYHYYTNNNITNMNKSALQDKWIRKRVEECLMTDQNVPEGDILVDSNGVELTITVNKLALQDKWIRKYVEEYLMTDQNIPDGYIQKDLVKINGVELTIIVKQYLSHLRAYVSGIDCRKYNLKADDLNDIATFLNKQIQEITYQDGITCGFHTFNIGHCQCFMETRGELIAIMKNNENTVFWTTEIAKEEALKLANFIMELTDKNVLDFLNDKYHKKCVRNLSSDATEDEIHKYFVDKYEGSFMNDVNRMFKY